MFLQNDPYLNSFAKWGCYFCSIMYLAELLLKRKFTYDEVLAAWFKAYQDKEIDLESTVKDPEGIFKDLGLEVKFKGKAPGDYVPMPGEYEICEWVNPKSGYLHFTFGDKTNPKFWDPLGKSKTVNEGYIRSKRIFATKWEG